MKLRGKDATYLTNQGSANIAHANALLENPDDHAKAERILDDVEQFLPETILEIGTRLGLIPFRLARAYPTILTRGGVWGIDIVPEFIEIARARAKLVPSEVTPVYEVADMHQLPFLDRGMEYVFSIAVMEHAHDPASAIAEAFRVCSNRIYLEIDLCPNDRSGSHYTVETDPDDWLDLCPQDFTLRHTICGRNLTIEGQRK